MNAITTASLESVTAPTVEDDIDVLALCELWRAMDFPDVDRDDSQPVVVPLEPNEVP